MKALILFLGLVPAMAGAQKIMLLDRNLQKPFMPCDSVTFTEVASGGFPIYTSDINDVVNRLELFSRSIATGKALPAGADTLKTGHSILFLTRNTGLYHCVLQTKDEYFSIPMVIAAAGSRKDTYLRLARFIDYLRHNRSVVMQNGEKPSL